MSNELPTDLPARMRYVVGDEYPEVDAALRDGADEIERLRLELSATHDMAATLEADVLRLRAERDALRAALTWYADNLGNSKSMDYRVIVQDGGKRAKAALAARGKDE